MYVLPYCCNRACLKQQKKNDLKLLEIVYFFVVWFRQHHDVLYPYAEDALSSLCVYPVKTQILFFDFVFPRYGMVWYGKM